MNENAAADAIFERMILVLQPLSKAAEQQDVEKLVEFQREMAALGQKLKDMGAKQMATAEAMRADALATAAETDRVDKLVDAFVCGAKARHFARDEPSDNDLAWKSDCMCMGIAEDLDAIAPDRRSVLAPLLDHPDIGVCQYAGRVPINLMPDRALPVLRHIEETACPASAGMAAYTDVSHYEYTQKQKQEKKPPGT